MAGQDRGHFPRKEQPDVGRAYGDVPRAFDARFLHEDDAVVRLGKAEQKPRPQGDVPCDDAKVPPSATGPGRVVPPSSSIFAITPPPRLCPTRCTRSPSVASTNARRASAACVRSPPQERYRTQ